ncbi:MAG: glycoside hydrolase, partial [Flavobacteriia bacterium]|nr:glycoside hydrolase [Flavobacteriia bacterium]
MPREFRGVWIATVANIDWPKSSTDSWEIQQQQYLDLLDYYKDLNFNVVIVQIRTAGDAFYPTALAPWSTYLTGKQGNSPETKENPLTWMIQEAHARGLEFHAWLNPYRATMDLKTET